MAEMPKHIQLLDSCRTALKPLFRILLRSGISHKDFNEVAKSLFVEIATNEYGLRGRDTNVSRVAIMTGLTRKEVKKIRDAGWDQMRTDKVSTKLSPAAAILHYWHTDRDFLGNNGHPSHMPYEGHKLSFMTLAKKYGGDVPPGALFKELIRSEAVETDDNGLFFPVKRHFVPVDIDDRLILSLENLLGACLSNIEHNSRPGTIMGKGHISRRIFAYIPKSKLTTVRELARTSIKNYSESFDKELMQYAKPTRFGDTKGTKTSGICAFYFELDS